MRSTFAFFLTAAALAAQGLDPAALLKPATDTWASYNGDYTGRRYSPLKRINAQNVKHLSLAWAFQSKSVAIKSTPLQVNGILYFTVPDNVWAVDARSGREIWHYKYQARGGDHIGHRGVAMWKDRLYFETPDCHLICLNARNGSVIWDIEFADYKLGYFGTVAPLVVRDQVIIGVSGDVTDLPGFLRSVDAVTGKTLWQWNTEPKPGEPGSETWPQGTDAIKHGGGMTWITGSYDPETNLLYWSTGNPNPVLAGSGRMGDNLWTCSVVALNADTGKLVWYFQPSPHDVHDWDAVQTPVLFDGDFEGKPRKLIAQASRNGYFFLMDRVTGQHLLTAPFIETDWAKGIDERGRPVARPDKEPAPDGALVNPGSDGSTNWMSPTYSPDTGLFYVVARRIWSIFYLTASGKPEGWGGRDRNLYANSVIRALDYKTGKVRWSKEIGEGESVAGLLSTAGGFLFTADTTGNLMALDPKTGETLWHAYPGARVVTSPMTYELDGKQYIVVGAGDVLFAWTVNE